MRSNVHNVCEQLVLIKLRYLCCVCSTHTHFSLIYPLYFVYEIFFFAMFINESHHLYHSGNVWLDAAGRRKAPESSEKERAKHDCAEVFVNGQLCGCFCQIAELPHAQYTRSLVGSFVLSFWCQARHDEYSMPMPGLEFRPFFFPSWVRISFSYFIS